MEYAIGFIVGIITCILFSCVRREYKSTGARGISFLGYNCSTRLAKYSSTGSAPLRVWVKVYKPEPSPHPGNDPIAEGATEASQNMGVWEATNAAWPNTGDVFLFAWFQQTSGATINKVGPSKANCMGTASPPPPPPPPSPPSPPPPSPPPPPFGSPQKY